MTIKQKPRTAAQTGLLVSLAQRRHRKLTRPRRHRV